MTAIRSSFALVGSAALHGLVFALMWLHPWPDPPPPPPPPDGAPVSLAAFDFDDAPPESSSPTPADVATPPDEAPPAPPAAPAAASPAPDPAGAPADPPAPPPTAAAESGDGEQAAQETKKGPQLLHGAKARRPTRTPKPCPETVANIEQLGPAEWFVERALLEYYASHIAEIDALGSVWTHKSPDGKPDGFRVGLPRCTVLRDGGLKSGDIVHDINGIRINNVLQAVAAYVQLRKEPVLVVHVTRKKEDLSLTYHLEPREKKKKAGRRGADR